MSDVEPRCFFADWAVIPATGEPMPPCEGALVRGHLISKHRLLKAFRKGAWKDGAHWSPAPPFEAKTDVETLEGWTKLTLEEIQDDPRCWVPMCGGPTGIGGHHGMLDNANHDLSIPRLWLPWEVEEFAIEFRLERELDRVYGARPSRDLAEIGGLDS